VSGRSWLFQEAAWTFLAEDGWLSEQALEIASIVLAAISPRLSFYTQSSAFPFPSPISSPARVNATPSPQTFFFFLVVLGIGLRVLSLPDKNYHLSQTLNPLDFSLLFK
jgi:hypothetical protein